VTDAFGYWLAGLIDGEGCFRVHRQKGGTRCPYYAPSFSLKLREDDAPLLDEIIRVTGIGRRGSDTKRSKGSNPCAIWRVDTRASTEALVEILDRYSLLSRKARDYLLWREAVIVRRSMPRGNRWHGGRDWTPLIDLKRRIEEARAYVPYKEAA